MGIVDVIIILFLLFGAVVGFHKGFFSRTVSFVGLIVILVASFLLKDIIANFLLNFLPFFIKDAEILNILLYQAIGFVIVFGMLFGIFQLVVTLTNVFEKVLTLTIILGIPSKVLGAFVGFLEAVLISFVALLILNQPMFNLTMVHESKVGEFILTKTPIISNLGEGTIKTMDEIHQLTKHYENKDYNTFNKEGLKVMLNNKIVSKETVQMLIDNKKITFEGAKEILENY